MLLEMPSWFAGYEQILKDCRPGRYNGGATKTVLILCNGDVDALSSARILTYMLRSDGIPYILLPCFNYRGLEERLRAMGGGSDGSSASTLDDVRALVLLNFGAERNLTRLWKEEGLLPNDSEMTLYVMDCRRPIHLANVHAPQGKVCVFMDGTATLDEFPTDGDHLSGDSSSSSSSEGSSDEDDDDDDEDDRKKPDESDDEGEEEAYFDDVEESGRQKEKHDVASKGDSDEDVDYDGEDEQEAGGNDDGDADNDDDDINSDAPPSKRQKKDEKSGEDEDVPEEEEADQASGSGANPQDQEGGEGRAAPNLVSPRELHQQRLQRIRAYYNNGSYYGSPAAFVAYTLATQLRFGEQGDLLWLACVGVTDAYLHSRLDLSGYASLASDLRRMCQALYPNDMYERTMNTVYAEDLIEPASRGGEGRTKITFSDNGRIFAQDDYRFFLLRHSSLLESMVQSDYVSTKLQVWTKKGQQRLMEMLAKMGYPLDECRQPFVFMKPSLRRRLKDKISYHAAEYNLEHFKFTSFVRVTGYNSLVSASDTSYAVTALLERDPPANTVDENSSSQEDEQKAMVEAFNGAYDALSPHCEPISGGLNSMNAEGCDSSTLVNGGALSSSVGLGAGIRQAMTLQNSITQLAVGLVERRAITLLRHFRYAYVTSNTVGETQFSRNDIFGSNNSNNTGNDKRDHIFSKPLALTRLASYLMDMHRENCKWTGSKARPLVLIAEKPKRSTCLVVGFEYPERHGNFIRNRFGKYFEMTAASMNGTFKFDHFDSNVVEVAGADVQRFLEQLHYLLDSM